MKTLLFSVLLFVSGCCFGMQENESFKGGFGDIFTDTNAPQSITVITSDSKTIKIEPEIARCMAFLINIKGDEGRAVSF